MREPVVVLFHLNGYTKVEFERLVGKGMVVGEPTRDLPTRLIPPHLRPIGSRFLVEWTPFSYGLNLGEDEMRRHLANDTRVLGIDTPEEEP